MEHAAIARDGDVLIIGVSTSLTEMEAANLKAQMMDRLPGLADVVIMSSVTALVTYRGVGHDVPRLIPFSYMGTAGQSDADYACGECGAIVKADARRAHAATHLSNQTSNVVVGLI